MKTTPLLPFLVATALCILAPSIAHAHAGHNPAFGFGHGFQHPIGGLDHLLAIIAVGLWAAQHGGAARWAIPLSFVGVMTLGATLAVAGVAIPMIEAGILASVLIIGLLIAFAIRLPLIASMAIVGLFAVFHGYGHGAEMPIAASGTLYAAGFLLATTLLLFAGVSLGLIQKAATARPAVRFAGASIVVIGIAQVLW
jgi:urease accessory protein